MRRYAFCLGSLVSGVVVACMAGLPPAASSAESPPAREPREKLTINGKDVFEGRRVLFDEDSYPRQGATSSQATVSATRRRNVRFASPAGRGCAIVGLKATVASSLGVLG